MFRCLVAVAVLLLCANLAEAGRRVSRQVSRVTTSSVCVDGKCSNAKTVSRLGSVRRVTTSISIAR